MESKRRKKRVLFLPTYFKIIGLVLGIISLAAPIALVQIFDVQWTSEEKDLWFTFSTNGFLLGLLLIALSRDRVEDEMTVDIRLKAMATAFTFIVFYVILNPVVGLLLAMPKATLSAQNAVGSMLFGYLITYYVQKLRRE